MSLFFISVFLVHLTWWMFSSQVRLLLYREWNERAFSTVEYLNGVAKHAMRSLSPQNLVAQAFVDGELKTVDQRKSFMLLSFQKLSLIGIGLLLSATLQIEVFIGCALLATLLLMVFFKRPIKAVQIALIASLFFGTFQWSFYQASQWIYSQDASPIIFFLTDISLQKVGVLLAVGIVLTLLGRLEFWCLWLTTILFFSGGVALINALTLLVAEALGWALYWFFLSFRSSKRNHIIFREFLGIHVVWAGIFIFVMGYLKGLGFLDIRVFDAVTTKKITFLVCWGLWEMGLTILLMLWGHFRSRSRIRETTDIEVVQLPRAAVGRGFFKYADWLHEQLFYRRNEIEQRLRSLESHQLDSSSPIPENLRQKTQLEVESLKGLLGSLPESPV